MRFGKWILAASVPLMLTGCGGGGGGAYSAAVQGLVDNATNLEMTDRIDLGGNRVTVSCSGTVCESSRGEGDYSLTYEHKQWIIAPSDTGATEFATLFQTGTGTYNRARHLGQYSGFYTIGFFRGSNLYIGGWSASFGSSENRPRGSARWTGNMAGFETRGGIKVNGRATVNYSLSDNTVDVRLYSISGSGYRGFSEFNWEDIRVRNDGSFYFYGTGNSYMEGNFYGPNSEETAGVFDRNFVSGGWFARKE